MVDGCAVVASKLRVFVSYVPGDRPWAEWISWILEDAGHLVTLEAWDFLPGSNAVLQRDMASQEADRVVVLLSPEYLASTAHAADWATALMNDPGGAHRYLVPVKVRACEPTGLLKPIVGIQLVGTTDEEARLALLQGIAAPRLKPAAPPPFPGPSAPPVNTPPFPGHVDQTTPAPAAPPANVVGTVARARRALAVGTPPRTRSAYMRWTDMPVAPAFSWCSNLSAGKAPLTSGSTIELHLLPVEPATSAVPPAHLGVSLTAAGRAAGLFARGESIEIHAEDGTVTATAARGPHSPGRAGLAVVAGRQLSAWSSSESGGPAIDPLAGQLEMLLTALLGLVPAEAGQIAIGVGLEVLADTPSRTRLPLAKSLDWASLRAARAAITTEIAAQLIAATTAADD